MNIKKYCFELERIQVALENILPTRFIKNPQVYTSRYGSILSSIKEVGLIEPLIVYPAKNLKEKYMLLDGHLRYYCLKELQIAEVHCLLSTDDEGYTYNARINRVSPIQEYSMITKAIKNGVSPERIALALHRNIDEVRANMNILDGLASEVIDLLKTKRISANALKFLKRVKPLRQIEIAELMVATCNFSVPYIRALLVGTATDMLCHPKKEKQYLSAEDVVRMEMELETIEKDFKDLEESYSDKVLNLTLAKGYIKKLIENSKISHFLSSRYADILSEFEAIAALESI
ncbi:MAG: plasmid partitioning protein RepB C-terminal domain-containing protein [Chthoniobacterales bacterium]